jgi:cell surface protein SprA
LTGEGARQNPGTHVISPIRGAANKKDDDKDDTGKDKKKKGDREPSTIEKIVVRPLLLLRRARFNYSEQLSTTIPGFMPRTEILGMNNFDAPGWDFVAGIQPRIRTLTDDQRFNPTADNLEGDWLRENADWISPSVFQNREVIQLYTQSYDARVTLEPFQDFRVDIELTKTFTENYSETFKDTSLIDGVTNLVHTVPLNTGQMQISYLALNTLFQDSNDEITELFEQFERNRVVISQRLGTGIHGDENLGAEGYTEGYGKTQQEVILPAFIAAYTDQNPESVRLNIFDAMPRVNWRLQYNGLSRIPLFKEIFQNFSLTHGYRSTLAVNNFRSSLPYLATLKLPAGWTRRISTFSLAWRSLM